MKAKVKVLVCACYIYQGKKSKKSGRSQSVGVGWGTKSEALDGEVGKARWGSHNNTSSTDMSMNDDTTNGRGG